MRCHEKQGNTEASKRLSNRLKVILILAGAALMLVGGLEARYFWQSWSEYAAVTSEPFYFTADLLGDTEMTAGATTETENLYSMANPSGTWHLYGGGEHKVDFTIQNYYDDLRVTQNVIEYTVTVNGIDGVTVIDAKDNTALPEGSLTLGTSTASADGKESYTKAEQKLSLTIPAGYTEEKTVTVVITSTKPYKKTLTLNFKVYPASKGLIYEVVDSVNSPYAELIIRNDTVEDIAPTIDWSGTSLSIDNTNELTFKYADGAFTQQAGIENKVMQISRNLNIGESVSIYFFKSESKNYAIANTTVNTTINDSNYTITIYNPA